MTDEILPGNASISASFLGRFENYLTYADKQFDVTVSDAPTSGSTAFMFSTSPETSARWNSSVSFPVVITIDFGANVHYWKVIGINFIYSRLATNVKIEVYRSDISNWETLLDISDNTSQQVYVNNSRNWVQQIRYTFSGIKDGQTEIAVEELFGVNYHYRGQGWVDRGGDSIFGGVSIEADMPQIEWDNAQFPSPYNTGLTSVGYGNLLFKHTGSQHTYPDDVYTSLFLVMVENPPPYEGEYCPMLATDHGLWVEKDILTYGALFTFSDPGKASGGGAIMMGHGFTGATAEPQIQLSDTIGEGSGATATLTVSSGVITNVTVTNGGSDYTFADVTVIDNPSILGQGSGARLAPVIVDGHIQSITVYDGGSGYSSLDTVSITNNPHNTLYLLQRTAESPYTSPGNLDLGDLTAHGHLSVGDAVASDLNPNPDLDLGNYSNPWASVVTSSLWVKSPNSQFGVTAGDEWNGSGYDVYLHPQNPANGGLGLGTANYPFKWVDASCVYTDYLNSLSTSLHLESATEKIVINDAADANTGLELGNSSTSGGVVYIDFHYGRNTTEDYNVRLINDSDCILTFKTRTTTGGILPSSGGQYVLGSSSKDWSYVYANYLRYDVNCVQYDALDDLALVKNHKSKKTIDKQSGEEITVIDMKESFPFLLADDKHIAHEKLQGYMLGCVKALILRVEALENQLKQNQTPD